MKTQRTVLVIGANGGIGSEACTALRRHGWRVRALARKPPSSAHQDGIEWQVGDALDAGDVLHAAHGVDVIVHAVNPPGYRGWGRTVLPMLDNTLAAARASGARIVLPGTIYNYGPDAFPVLTENSPQHPRTRKGGIRVEMERRLESAAREGVRVLILRCGDFFGPRAGNNWFAQGLIKAGNPVTKISYPGDYSIGHAWAYLPDVGDVLARLLDRESDLATFERFHFGGHWLDGHAMLDAMRRVTANPRVKAGRFPWWLTQLASPFNETLRELCKMRYLWRQAIRLDDSKLKAFLGDALYTPLDQAVQSALVGAGCVTDTSAARLAHHKA